MAKRVNISKEKLSNLYINNKLTTYEIADFFGCSQGTIWKRLHKYNIPTRPQHPTLDISKEKLKNLYTYRRLSTWTIERISGVSRNTIFRKLKEFNIPTRCISESHLIYPRKSFDGCDYLKAYLIGFRIGDLRVRKKGKNKCKTINVDCGSTIKAQIDLIENLFKDYGKVWISKMYKGGKVQIETYLDLSFSFLLKKEAPEEYFINEKLFFPFLAGFSDAESYIFSKGNKDGFVLANCDYNLLLKIHSTLEKFGIKCSNLVLEKKKGTINKFDSYSLNEDYWSFSVNRKMCLLDLFKKIGPHSRHRNKIKAINKAISNIKRRNLLYGIHSKSTWKNDKEILYLNCN